MEDMHDITRSNLETIKVQEEDIKRKEKELSTVRRQHQQMTGQSNSRTTDPGNQGMREELQSYETKLPELLTNIAGLEKLVDQGTQKRDHFGRPMQKLLTEQDMAKQAC